MSCGIYSITNVLNGKRYIGQSMNVEQRWREWRSRLNRGTCGHNRHLQDAWTLYGQERFEFRLLIICTQDAAYLALMEQRACDLFRTTDKRFGYNSRLCVLTNAGVKRRPLSVAHRMALSLAHRGKTRRPRTEEEKRSHSLKMIGKLAGDKNPMKRADVRSKVSAARMGKSPSAASRIKISATLKELTAIIPYDGRMWSMETLALHLDVRPSRFREWVLRRGLTIQQAIERCLKIRAGIFECFQCHAPFNNPGSLGYHATYRCEKGRAA